MEKITEKRHDQFKSTDAYQEALLYMKYMVTRGRDARSKLNVGSTSEDYNEFTKGNSDVQIINYLAYACNKMISVSESSDANELSNFLNGTDLLVKKEDQPFFEKIVSKIPASKTFLLIPLMFGIEEKRNKWKAYNSLLIKCEVRKNCDFSYIDMMGQEYRSFQDFLNKNNLPLCTLYYPPDGFMETDDNGEIVLLAKTVGVMNMCLAVTDAVMATFGMFVNFVFPSSRVVTSTYFTIRGIQKLYDAYDRGQSLNPFEVRYHHQV